MGITAFVILHYGDWSVTRACVDSIAAMQMQECIRIVVVDNDDDPSSAADSRKALQAAYKNLTVLINQEEHGFSHANNLGYRFARETLHAAFILVLNNDIIFPRRDFIRRLQHAYRRHACHVLAPAVLRGRTHEPQNPMDSRLRTENEAAFTIAANKMSLLLFPAVYPVLVLQEKLARKKLLESKHANLSFYHQVQNQIVPFGACLIFTPLFVKDETAAFSPETAFYYEEYLLALRCSRKGYTIIYDPVMKVLHESGQATKQKHGTKRKKMRFQMQNTLESAKIYKRELEK